MKGCIDALQANYPAVTRLVGEDWFRAAAAAYASTNPPRTPMLVEYGASFPDFLTSFAPAAELPYLPAVARLDRFWTECHVAPDEPPPVRWAWFELPAYSIWSRTRAGDTDLGDIEWRAEGALLTRPNDVVQWISLQRDEYSLLESL
jgi:hypothetical protein